MDVDFKAGLAGLDDEMGGKDKTGVAPIRKFIDVNHVIK